MMAGMICFLTTCIALFLDALGQYDYATAMLRKSQKKLCEEREHVKSFEN